MLTGGRDGKVFVGAVGAICCVPGNRQEVLQECVAVLFCRPPLCSEVSGIHHRVLCLLFCFSSSLSVPPHFTISPSCSVLEFKTGTSRGKQSLWRSVRYQRLGQCAGGTRALAGPTGAPILSQVQGLVWCLVLFSLVFYVQFWPCSSSG